MLRDLRRLGGNDLDVDAFGDRAARSNHDFIGFGQALEDFDANAVVGAQADFQGVRMTIPNDIDGRLLAAFGLGTDRISGEVSSKMVTRPYIP